MAYASIAHLPYGDIDRGAQWVAELDIMGNTQLEATHSDTLQRPSDVDEYLQPTFFATAVVGPWMDAASLANVQVRGQTQGVMVPGVAAENASDYAATMIGPHEMIPLTRSPGPIQSSKYLGAFEMFLAHMQSKLAGAP